MLISRKIVEVGESDTLLAVMDKGALLAGAGPRSGWACTRLELPDPERLIAEFHLPERAGRVRVEVTRPGVQRRIFRRLEHCEVGYRGELAAASEQRKAEVGALILGVAEWVERCLGASDGATLAEALGRDGALAHLRFDADSLRHHLTPSFRTGERSGGWRLSDVYPMARTRDAPDTPYDLVIDFRHDVDERQMTFTIGPHLAGRETFVRTAHFDLVTRHRAHQSPPDALSLCAVLGLALQLLDHDGLRVTFPEPESTVRHLPLLDAADVGAPQPDQVLNLAVDTDCGQNCSFCTVRKNTPPRAGDRAMLNELCEDVVRARKRGLTRLRLNGYDPLRFEYVLELVDFAREAGFDTMEVFSPFTRLADAEFRDALLSRLPERSTFFVPLYSAAPEAHDRVVGVPGAHAEVVQAIDALLARVGAERVVLLSVVTADNLDDVESLARFAQERGVVCAAHLPYPSSEDGGDRYHDAAPRQTDAAERLLPLFMPGSRVRLEGFAPCVVRRVARARGIATRVWLERWPTGEALPGTEYRDERYHQSNDLSGFAAQVVPCPHVEHCALASVCYRCVLRSYEARYGLEELAPVDLLDLLGETSSRS